MKIFIGADHAGYELKGRLVVMLTELGYEVEDLGAHMFDIEDDYPDFIRPVAEAVALDSSSRGIVIGGSGYGEAMCANRVKGARALVFYGPMVPKGTINAEGQSSLDPYEIIKLARMHNDANILSIGVRFVSEAEIKEAVKIFLETKFSGIERHMRRIKKLDI